MDNNYYVYIHRNRINDKRYIGLTRMKPNERWREGRNYTHNQYFTRAVEKYGWDNFDHEIVATGLTAEQAAELEIELIKKYNTTNMRHGYNLDSGGSHPKHSESTKEKIRQRITGIKRSPETIEKMRKASMNQKHLVGYKHTEEAKQKNREAHIGKTHTLTEDAKERIMLSQSKRKEVICLELNMEFPSIGSAAKYVGTSQGSISSVLTRRSKTAGGYHWQYK